MRRREVLQYRISIRNSFKIPISRNLVRPGHPVDLLNPSHWRHNGRDGVSNHQPHDCLLYRLFRRRLENTLKLCATGLRVGNSPVTGEFPTQMASNAENVSNWWRHHALWIFAQSTAGRLSYAVENANDLRLCCVSGGFPSTKGFLWTDI